METSRLSGAHRLDERIHAVLAAETDDFLELIQLAGLDPRRDLRGMDLRELNLDGADLRGADLYKADISGASLVGADLRDAMLSQADLRQANLRGAQLQGASLVRSNLGGANLSLAKFQGADLAFADLTGAKLVRTNLKDAKLVGAVLDRAQIGSAYMVGAQIDPNEMADAEWVAPPRIKVFKPAVALAAKSQELESDAEYQQIRKLLLRNMSKKTQPIRIGNLVEIRLRALGSRQTQAKSPKRLKTANLFVTQSPKTFFAAAIDPKSKKVYAQIDLNEVLGYTALKNIHKFSRDAKAAYAMTAGAMLAERCADQGIKAFNVNLEGEHDIFENFVRGLKLRTGIVINIVSAGKTRQLDVSGATRAISVVKSPYRRPSTRRVQREKRRLKG